MVLRRYVFNLCNPLNDRCAELDMILESYAKIDSNSFKTGNTPHKLRSAVQYGAQQLQIHVHAYQDMIPS